MTAVGVARERVSVALGRRSYDVVIGPGLLAEAGDWIRPLARRPRVFLVTDERVAPLHLAATTAALARSGLACETVTVPAGEASKSFPQLAALCSQLLSHRLERSDLLLALGGGVIGDLVGFAAAILLRGIDFVQLPTTLLAQVDSSVGGKTAIDVPEGKNLVGAFHQPRLVLADSDTLRTLPARELRAGYAEVVKYGLIDRPDFFAWLEIEGAKLLAGDATRLGHAVSVSCHTKAAIVARDETETGDRALLNLGHTFGHALETLAGFDERLKHGEAVAIGLCQAFRFSAALGLAAPGDAERVARHLRSVGLPTHPAAVAGLAATPAAVLAAMQRDKKTKDGRVTFVLARGIGQAFIARDIEAAAVEAFLTTELS